ncbi:unnamed protein product [Vicia faba]|uniref:Uncharacterized protein n=1 Tax=Vicia faba TaxID=3906 RepID=A0AAV0Z8Z5_VICFA|nr:unnamed protein product [Vicia faba]
MSAFLCDVFPMSNGGLQIVLNLYIVLNFSFFVKCLSECILLNFRSQGTLNWVYQLSAVKKDQHMIKFYRMLEWWITCLVLKAQQIYRLCWIELERPFFIVIDNTLISLMQLKEYIDDTEDLVAV